MKQIMQKMNQPIVTVGVITYNSSKYVIETLESIKAQSYPHLILQISDDCSTDNTVEICEKWIENNKDRFVKTKIIVPKHNTGVSGNANRSWDACETEWYKGIAGDDLLLPNCIEDNIDYVSQHPEAVFVFSKPKAFGEDLDYSKVCMKKFNLSFFNEPPEQQLRELLIKNCIPAATVFCNIIRIRQVKLRHDERIPSLEDWPKWINALRKGLKFHYFDNETVAYRIHKRSLSNSEHIMSLEYYESYRLVWYYYTFPLSYNTNPDATIRIAINNDLKNYQLLLDFKKQRDNFYNLKIIKMIRNIKHSFFSRSYLLLFSPI